MKRILILLAASLALFACRQAQTPIKVMTFNVRAGVANDHENSWQYRRKAAADMILDQRLPFSVCRKPWISSWITSWSSALCINVWAWAVRMA